MGVYNGVQEPVTAAVWYALNNYCYSDAIFIAERLHAEVHSMDTAYLLATSYYRSGRLQQAKHLLKSRDTSMSSDHHLCSLLYAQCCLDLKEYQEGLLALKCHLALQDTFQEDLTALFGDDVGVAFLLLGRLKFHLQHKQEAASCFRAALRHNPFLWSAFEMLCEMGEKEGACPDELFNITRYPGFLRPHPQTSYGSAPISLEPCSRIIADSGKYQNRETQEHEDLNLICAESASSHHDAIPEGHVTAFQPIRGNKTVFMTPDIFTEPSVGVAIASSTPARSYAVREKLSLTTETPYARHRHADAGSEVRSGWSTTEGAQVKGPLNFGSTGVHKSLSFSRDTPPAMNPSFGTLSLTTPTGGEWGGVSSSKNNPKQALNFSSSFITPSPQPLPPDYLKLIQSAPKSAQISRGYSATSGQPSPPRAIITRVNGPKTGPQLPYSARPPSTPHPLSKITMMAQDPSKSVSSPTMSRGGGDALVSKSTAPLRRSIRLSGTTSKRLSDHALHGTRSKSRMSSVRRGNADKKTSKGVTFNTSRPSPSPMPTPIITKRSVKMAPPTSVGVSSMGNMPLPLSPSSSPNILARNQNTENLLRSAMYGESVANEGKEADKKEGVADELKNIEAYLAHQQMLEQTALSGLASLMQLLVHIGRAYQALSNFDLGKAIRLFRSLEHHQLQTSWVLEKIAQAYFAAERFNKSAEIFKQIHSTDPHRQEGMELYSSSLWHLQREVDLSVLAHHLTSSNKHCPQAMCAMASLKNLHKDSEGAVKYLTMAIQARPGFTYAYTLLGHEYWLAKDYDKSFSSFQDALSIHVRHYNAWYGMAHVSFAQEKYQSAEFYAARALSINGCSSISCTQMGLAQLRQSKCEQALSSFNKALAINPSNPIPLFHKAKTLEAMGSLEESLEQLDMLVKEWPKEPNVFISKGKILKKLSRTHEAALQFSWALECSRSGSSSNSQLREEIDQAYHNQNASGEEVREETENEFLPLGVEEEEEGEGERDTEDYNTDDSMVIN